MIGLGFKYLPLGPEGPAAWGKAASLYGAWLEAKSRAYPKSSLGAYYDRFRRSIAWTRKAPRTREDYARAWKHIEPVLARSVITEISVDDCEAFYVHMETNFSAAERYRTIKVLRILFDDAKLRLGLATESPAKTLPNRRPKGRSALWFRQEVEELIEGAETLGRPGMAVALRITWDTLFSPVDIWSLTRGQLKRDGDGWYLERARTKTNKQTFGALSDATAEAVLAYIGRQPTDVADDQAIVRQRNGHAYRSKDTFSSDFRDVRQAVFPGEKRTFMDLRRSGNVEADIAGVDKATMGKILANGVADSSFLDETYTPPTVAKAREVLKLREEGARKLAVEMERISGKIHSDIRR
jgi:hypothetical protein